MSEDKAIDKSASDLKAVGEGKPKKEEVESKSTKEEMQMESKSKKEAESKSKKVDAECKSKKEEAESKADEPTGRAIYLTGHGGYDKLKVKLEPIPEPGAGEVVVKVKVCGLNFAELACRQGLYDRIPKLPTVLGYEGSGVVEKVGTDCSLKVGQRVVCLKDWGMWREFACVPETNCFIMPEKMTFEEAAAIPVNYVTAYLMLFDFGNLKPGNKVLVHMAAGGVGWAATQLCKTVPDVTVFGTASAHKHEAIKANGVDHPIDYHKVDYAEVISKQEPRGIDIVLDPLSGADSVKGYGLLKPMGKIIHFGAANMIKENKSLISVAKTWWQSTSINRLELISRNRAVCGLHLGHMVGEVGLITDTCRRLLGLYSSGQIRPRVDTVWPLEQIGKAMAHMHNRKNIGKILLSPELPADARVGGDETIPEEAPAADAATAEAAGKAEGEKK